MTRTPEDRGAELRELFFESAQELLQSLNDEAMKLEKLPGDPETVRSIRRIVHTLKGDAAATGLPELSELAHELEDALAQESAASHGSLVEIVFKAADIFTEMLAAYRGRKKLPSSASLRKKIAEMAAPAEKKSRAKKTKAAGSAQPLWTEYEKVAMQAAFERGRNVYEIQVQIDPQCVMPIAARQLVLNALNGVAEVLGSRPEAGSTESAKQVHLLVASDQTADALTVKSRIPTVTGEVRIRNLEVTHRKADARPKSAVVSGKDATGLESQPERGESSQAVATPMAHADDASVRPASAPAENILRVDAERIDNVLNLVGELIIGKSMLQQALNEFGRRWPKDAARGQFADAIAFQSRVLNDLQRSVMKVRMVPVEQLFRRFPRMVRDVAKQCGRDVELVLRGEDTDLDKGLLDGIAEPLTHLVRNAVSHGIENTEDRVRAGKPARGTLRLEAYHQGNQVVVEVSDDGRGVDIQKVKARAIERGLLSSEEAGRAGESAILNLIFQPGFSTADEITEISGRGVGLDVVQSVLQKLKGTVQVETRPGQGTTFRLRLPLTLAIIKALLFRVEQRLYAIPLNAVAEISRAHESDLHQVDNREVLQLRKQVMPVVRLGNRPAANSDHDRMKIFVLVVRMGERRFGLLVNSLEGEEELVIKALDDQTVETDMVSGASILGDGRVVLILNLGAIIDRFSRLRPETDANLGQGLLVSPAAPQDGRPSVREAHA